MHVSYWSHYWFNFSLELWTYVSGKLDCELRGVLCMCVCWGMQLYSGSRQNKGEGQVFWMCGQWDRQQREGLFCPACVAVVHIWSQGFKRAHASRHKNCGLLTAVVGGRGAVRAAILFAVGSGEVGLRRASAKTHLAAAGGHLGHALFSLQSLRPGQTQTERFHVLINQPFFLIFITTDNLF